MKIIRAKTQPEAIKIAAYLALKKGRNSKIVKTKYGYEVRVPSKNQK